MPVLPEEITAAGLRTRWRGYDRTQVNTLLGQVGADYAGALDRIADTAEDRARARTERAELQQRLDAVHESAHAGAAQARRDADVDAAAIRDRAEHAAALIVRQAEQTAEALTGRAQAMHAAAQADTDAARARLDDADRRARQLEDAARDRWETLRAETEARFEQLQREERRVADRTRHIETALAALRSQMSALGQVQQVEQALAEIRSEARGDRNDTANGVRP